MRRVFRFSQTSWTIASAGSLPQVEEEAAGVFRRLVEEEADTSTDIARRPYPERTAPPVFGRPRRVERAARSSDRNSGTRLESPDRH